MNKIDQITEKELLKKVEDAVSKKKVLQKPLLILTKDGSDYICITDSLSETYNVKNINTDPSYYEFVRVDGNLKMSFNGEIFDGHHADVDIYEYLGGPLGFDESIHRYCLNLIEYESKPVISFICVADKNCSVECIPAWIKEKFELAMLKFDSPFCGK